MQRAGGVRVDFTAAAVVGDGATFPRPEGLRTQALGISVDLAYRPVLSSLHEIVQCSPGALAGRPTVGRR